MNSDLETIREKLKAARAELMRRQNVVATGIGYKIAAGQKTPDLSIVCSVEVKKPKSKLSNQDLVPSTIQGIPTDVQPTGVLRAFQEPTERFRPAPGGVSIGHFQITAGTLGCLVKKGETTYVLSNNHVLANSNEASPGDPILQPGPHDGGTEAQDQIAELSEFVPISFEGSNGGVPCPTANSISSLLNYMANLTGSRTRFRTYRVQQTENKVDCAIAKPLNVSDVKNEIVQIGTIAGVLEAELGMKIKKSGRTTGLTTGTIDQVDVSARVSYGTNRIALFTDQLVAGPMSQGGDSGSAVLSESNHLIGLLFAGSDTSTIINRISNVFDGLGVTLV